MPFAWGIGMGSASGGRGKERRVLFCFDGSCLNEPIHEEFVIRDVERIWFADDLTMRLRGR